IIATARTLGLTIKAARSVEALEALARQQAPSGVLVDLGNPGLDVPDLIARLRTACPVLPRVVGYGSHVDAAGLGAARAAGCHLALPGSAFVEQLPTALPGWLASSSD